MAFGPHFLKSFPGKLWVSRHWVCSWGPGICPAWFTWFSAHGDTLVLNLLSFLPESQPRVFPGKSKGQEPGQCTSLQVAPCPPLHLVLEQVQRQPSWGMGNWILTMGRLKKVQQKAYRYKGASGISAIFWPSIHHSPFYRKERLRENSIIYLRSSGSES